MQGGAIKDTKDDRDLMFSDIIAGGDNVEFNLPKSFLLDYDFPVKNQGSVWSCIGQSVSAHKQYQEDKELSARFVYRKCKDIDGYNGKGTFTRIGVKVACDYGDCEEILLPEADNNNEEKYLGIKIGDKELDNAKNHKSKKYIRVGYNMGNIHEDIKQALFEYKTPIVLAIPWYKNYNQAEIPSPPVDFKFGHGVLVLGWREDNYLVCLNSWSSAWADKGRFYLPPQAPKYDAWVTIDEDEIIMPPKIQNRDIKLEQDNATKMRDELYDKFAPYDKARGVAGKEWLLIVQAITYRGYSYTDIINYCYAKSRGKEVPFDLNNKR